MRFFAVLNSEQCCVQHTQVDKMDEMMRQKKERMRRNHGKAAKNGKKGHAFHNTWSNQHLSSGESSSEDGFSGNSAATQHGIQTPMSVPKDAVIVAGGSNMSTPGGDTDPGIGDESDHSSWSDASWGTPYHEQEGKSPQQVKIVDFGRLYVDRGDNRGR